MDGTMECELPADQFNFLFAGQTVPFGYWEDVKVIREGCRAQVEEMELKTEEDNVNEEAERSRLKRAELEKQPGRLKRPQITDSEYHPNRKPE